MLETLGIENFNPVQEKALATRFIENRANLVVASPTGSGKTLVALLAALEVVKRGKKVVFTCPLRALASEHFEFFKKLTGVKVALSVGDLDSQDAFLNDFDLIVSTTEKIDSLMRHKSKFIPEVGLLVVDEVHLLDSDRGATLETVITRFRQLLPDCQVIALSATVPNASEVADWLNAELVESDWRPTKLVKGVFFNGVIESENGVVSVGCVEKTPVLSLVGEAVKQNKQVLVFVNSRRSAVSEARKISSFLGLSNNILADKVLNVLNPPTRQCRDLSECVRKGAGFHTAGLVHEQRKLVENAFRDGVIKVIVATPTLALGVNTPTDVTVIRDLYRYSQDGLVPIPVREYFQMSGRAGRIGFSDTGLSVCIARNQVESEGFFSGYVCGVPEKVYSRLAFEPVLRTQLLTSIALGFTPSMKSLDDFLLSTFYAFQYEEVSSLKKVVDSILSDLVEWGFVQINKNLVREGAGLVGGNLVGDGLVGDGLVGDDLVGEGLVGGGLECGGVGLFATALGKRVSELYLDPLSAHKLLVGLKSRVMGELGFLYLLSSVNEVRPFLRPRKSEVNELLGGACSNEGQLGFDCVRMGFEEYDFLDKYKTCLLLRDWVNEVPEDVLLEKFGVAPGLLRTKLSNWEWVCHGVVELARLEKISVSGSCEGGKNLSGVGLRGLEKRIKYGVKSELLPFVGLKGVGRVRARKLFNAGVRDIGVLKKTSDVRLVQLLGFGLAKSVKKQLGVGFGLTEKVRGGSVFSEGGVRQTVLSE